MGMGILPEYMCSTFIPGDMCAISITITWTFTILEYTQTALGF